MAEKESKTRAKKEIQKSQMTPIEFKARLNKIGYSKESFAKLIGIDGQTARGWKQGDIPLYAEKFIDMLETLTDAFKARDIFERIYRNNIVYESAKSKQLLNSGNS